LNTCVLARARYFYASAAERNQIRASLETVIFGGGWRKLKTARELRTYIEAEVVKEIETEETSAGRLSYWGKKNIEKFKRYMAKLEDSELENVMGRVTPEDVVEVTKKEHVVVLDVSAGGKDEKLGIFLTVANHLRKLMQDKQVLRLALVIDEGPQYCPFMPKGMEAKTCEKVSELCALGRSYQLCVVLLSQGIAGEIGINAAVRRNLNTQFIGKIHPLDMMEAKNLLAQGKIEDKSLTLLPEGDFYILGKMNPSPVPLLIHFDLPEGVT